MVGLSMRLHNSEAYKARRMTYWGSLDLGLPYLPGKIAGTDEYEKAELLTSVSRTCVVVMPDSRFPYLAHSGEFPKALNSRLESVLEEMTGTDQAREKLQIAITMLREELLYYERVCQRYGFTPPYPDLLSEQPTPS